MINTLYIATYDIKISFEFLIILVLFIYITYLHLQLSKKNFIIKTYIDKYDDGKVEKKDLITFLEKLRNPDYKGTVTKDKLLDKKFSKFLFEDDDKIKLFLHYTAKHNVAQKIIKEGFKFVNSFYKTAEYIYNDELYLVHRHHEHKQYGKYVIVICISKDMYDHYSEELNILHAKNIAVEQILTEKLPVKDEEGDEIYILPKQFIKGYFNYMDGTIVENPDFNYNYHSDIFEQNLKNLQVK